MTEERAIKEMYIMLGWNRAVDLIAKNLGLTGKQGQPKARNIDD